MTRLLPVLSRRLLLATAGFLGLTLPLTGPLQAAEPAAAAKKVKILYLTESRGFKHAPVTRKGDELASSEKAMIAIGQESGVFDVEPTQDAKVITPEKLKQIDVLAFYTTGALPISDENWKAVQDWVASGKGGFIGIHSATDTGWKYGGKEGMDYTTFINGKFAGHPWGQGTAVKIRTTDPDHPTMQAWGALADHKDEIYQYSNYDPKAVRVLQHIDFEGTALKKPYFVPITWVREIDKGRMFYTNLGHTPATWDDPRFRQTVVAAVKWVTHQMDGTAVPNPHVQAAATIHAFLAYGADGKGPAAGEPTAGVVLGKIATNSKPEWLDETAAKITALRGAAPPDLREPKAPNKNDEKKDPKKYAEEVAKYEKDLAKYKNDLPAAQAKIEKYNAERKALVDEIYAKAGQK